MPPFDISDLRATIVPKSDQLNAEQLLAGPMTVTVTDVSIGSDDQPLIIHHDKDKQRPFKPCKTMRKLLIFAWGEDGRKWPGQSMTLFNDPNVRFGGAEVGGIRISHMTGIERTVQISLTATKGKKALHTVQPLATTQWQRLAAGYFNLVQCFAPSGCLPITDERRGELWCLRHCDRLEPWMAKASPHGWVHGVSQRLRYHNSLGTDVFKFKEQSL